MANQNNEQEPSFIAEFFGLFEQADRPLAELQKQLFANEPDATESGFGPNVDFAIG